LVTAVFFTNTTPEVLLLICLCTSVCGSVPTKRDKMGEVIWKIGVLVTAVFLVLLTIPYWVQLDFSDQEQDWVWVAIDVISAILMIILAIIGVLGALKRSRYLLLIYAIGMICMFIFILIQLIINLIMYHDCNSNLYIFQCDYSYGGYLGPTIIMLVVTILGGIFAILLRKVISAEDKQGGTYY